MKKTGGILVAVIVGIFGIFLYICLCVYGKFDEERYPQAYLDAIYHEDYGDMADVLHIEEDDVEKYIQNAKAEVLQDAINEFCTYELTDANKKKLSETVSSLYNCAKYEVIDVQKLKSNTYCVTVSVYQFQFSDQLKKDVENSVKKNAYNLRGKNDAQLYDAAIEIVCDCLDEQIANPTYATSPTVVQLTFTRDTIFSSLYDVESDEEIEKFTHALIDLEE